MDMTQIRPTWLTALLPLLAVYQYGDREIVRAELFRMALSADAAAKTAALSEFDRVPPRAPLVAVHEAFRHTRERAA
jgi:hypothetical protein